MTMKSRLSTVLLPLLAGLVLLSGTAASAERNLRMHTSQPGSSPYVFAVTLQSVLQKNLPVRINLTSGMASTRSTLDAAKGQVDLYVGSQSINHFMSTGTGMFSQMDSAPELFKHVRTIMSYPLGPYHIMVHEDSGIESIKDIKGRRVFIGPPGGAATLVALSIIEGVTGYKAGEDYDMARLDWNSGQQAFQDGQVDMYIGPTQLPSASIEQLVMLQKIRFLGIPDEAFDSEPMKAVMALPGRTVMEIPPGIYGDNQVNEKPVKTVGTWVTLGTQDRMDEELGYQITKTLFENLDVFHNAAKFMSSVTLDNALEQVNTPLQAGALRYYREVGRDIPDDIVPPEAR